MQWLKRILIAIGIILIGAGGFILYDVAYSKGETMGYTDGYGEGKTNGYTTGYTLGRTEGYGEGYDSGKGDGYEEGYVFGKTDGYEVGVEAGLGHGYTLKDPTYEQAIAFVQKDRTDRNRYVEDTYVCSHFARDLCNNAEKAGLRSAFVLLPYPEGGHAIIAFDTVDEGLVFFEPRTDERVRPVVGERYYQCIEPREGYYYEKPSIDDTILDILVAW